MRAKAAGPSIIDSDAIGLTITASNVTVNNFTFGFDFTQATPRGRHRHRRRSSGYKFTNNNFAGGVDGVILNTQLDSGAQASTISGNTFSGNDEGVYTTVGTRNVTMLEQYLHQREKSTVDLGD